ncbi:hypothetical protein [Nonomuraea sp. NPDC003709]|uniref:hypothetical protein n=1 Tax=Nonomuraea sp. NPDC003709 TaxID=3154450 RepID=UPI0033ACA810
MKNTDDIDTITRSLARVEPGRPGGQASDAGARTLLASITATEPGPPAARPRPYRARRLFLGLAVAATLAAGIVVGQGLLRTGVPPSYAVTKDSDGVAYVKLRDFRDAAGLTRQLQELNVPAIVDYVPPGKMCREPRGTHVEDIPRGLYSVPENIPGEEGRGWQMRIDTKLFKPGQTFVWTIGETLTTTILMTGPVGPCVLEDRPVQKEVKPDYRRATVKGRSLAGLRVDEKTVGEVLPELRKRGLKVTFLIMEIAPGNPGGFGEGPTRTTPVGDDWVVWEAEESIREPGLIRLLVTDKRYDRNPVYGGPRDDVIKE